MSNAKSMYYEKRGQILVKNLRSRQFDAWYCPDRESALEKALELIPEGASVGWGGALSAQQIGLMDAVKSGKYRVVDRDTAQNPQQRRELMRQCLLTDVFLTGANAISMDGQMVNVDGIANRVAAIAFGPDSVLVIAGMNKVEDTLDSAVVRARTVAAPMNQQRFLKDTPCAVTGVCSNCKADGCICNQILITRNCRPASRIKFILVGEELGF